MKSAWCAAAARISPATAVGDPDQNAGGNPISALGAIWRAICTRHCPMPAAVLGRLLHSGWLFTTAAICVGSWLGACAHT
ncbi:hypothetical protein [Ralstonia sp. TCR112]|uniref:hypothetical protein n=1 Tax=Ralstonia sp. TCR112 TaxID=2601730 RepID=UPI0021C46751|nr:hypothetical protein [Ralstonia sp. TCR112]